MDQHFQFNNNFFLTLEGLGNSECPLPKDIGVNNTRSLMCRWSTVEVQYLLVINSRLGSVINQVNLDILIYDRFILQFKINFFDNLHLEDMFLMSLLLKSTQKFHYHGVTRTLKR